MTIKDIARQAGVHYSTVSLALRDSPQISAATKQRIKDIARRIGYSPNFAAQKMANLRSKIIDSNQTSIAWLNLEDRLGVWHDHPITKTYYDAAEKCAAELGLRLEEFSPNTEHLSDQRMSQILYSRGFQGVIFPQWFREVYPAGENWEHFATISLLHYPRNYTFDHVGPNLYFNMGIALDSLRSLGYRRIGLALLSQWDEIVYGQTRGRFMIYQESIPESERIPCILLSSHAKDESKKVAQAMRWIEARKPDAIVCRDLNFRDQLEAQGIRFPKDMGFVHLQLNAVQRGASGIDEHPEEIARTAVKVVADKIQSSEYGPATRPKEHAVTGIWVDGETTCKQHT